MVTNATLSRQEFNEELEECLTILENLTIKENIQSEKYTYYKCLYITPGLERRIVTVAVYD